ncbi:MAG: sensor histidine kinase [Gammaproteobacteria bacterium]
MGIYDAMAQDQPAPQKTDKPTLLIVDDEAGPRESLRIVFKDRYNCAVATCGRDGIEYARTHPVDAAILDIKMPDISGVDVLREIKKIDPDTECIMLTGYETLDTARAAVRHGAADYLNKPFDVFAIRELLEKCIARRHQKRTIIESLNTLQQMNEELSHELAESNRAVSAGVLSAGVVHEINNPLSIISGYAQMLGRDLAEMESATPDANQQIHQRLGIIQREVERCKDIAKRFLNFSRTAERSEEILDLGKLVEDAAALVKAHPSNQSAEIVVTPSESPLQIKGNPIEIMQVLINLGVNALQAVDGRGTLTLTARPAAAVPDHPGFRSQYFDPQKPLVKISVTDNGTGISTENLQKIFQPYFTTKQEGTGLGLAIVCKLVDSAGGLIDVQSTVGQGTTFNVYLPA